VCCAPPQDADWVKASAAHNKGRSASGSSLSNILGQQVARGKGRGGLGTRQVRSGGVTRNYFPRSLRQTPLPNGQATAMQGGAGGAGGSGGVAAAAAGLEGGCTWTQTPDEIEVVAPLPVGTTKKDVAVKFGSSSLEVPPMVRSSARVCARVSSSAPLSLSLGLCAPRMCAR
jgi:hypothetical protein